MPEKFTYFPDKGCVRTLRTLYVYASAGRVPCCYRHTWVLYRRQGD